MQPKEIVFVTVGALLLSNVSIIGTLFATGYFDDGSDTEETIEEAEVAEAPPPPPPEPPKAQRHSMSQAWYVCEDKVNESNTSKRFSYSFDSVASRYNEDSQTYQIFIETQTASRANSPMETKEVTCEVSAVDMSILSYAAMKK
ncbi:MAG: hypothetical protein ACRBBW_19820 [Cellvibrionaceae bacterium]